MTVGAGAITRGITKGIIGSGAVVSSGTERILATLFSRMTTPPSATQQAALRTFARRLRIAGIFDALDVLYTPNLMADAQSSCLDWIDPTRTATFGGSVAHHAFKHWWAPGSVGSFVDTNWNPATSGQRFPSATGLGCVGMWHGVGNYVGVRHAILETAGGTKWVTVYPEPESPVLYGSVGGGSATAATASITSVGRTHGVIVSQRDDASNVSVWCRGESVASGSSAFVATPNGKFPVFGRRTNGVMDSYFQDKVGGFFAGAKMTAAQHLELSAAWDEAALAVGAMKTPFVAWGDSLSTTGLAPWENNWVWQTCLGGSGTMQASWLFRRGLSQGVSGNSSAQILARIVADTTYQQYIGVCMMGRNDPLQTTGEGDATYANMLSAFNTINARSGKCLIMAVSNGQPNPGTSGLKKTTPNYEDLGEATNTTITYIHGLAAAGFGTKFRNHWADMVASGTAPEIARNVTPIACLIAGDAVHYGSGGTPFVSAQVLAGLDAQGW